MVARSAHIAASSVLFGGCVLGADDARLGVWLGLPLATGLALIASEVFHSVHWPYQGRGLMVWVKLALLGVVAAWGVWRVPLLGVALIIGSVGSHMPKRYRHWSLRHREVVD